MQTWFSATLCLSLGLYAFIVYDQVVLPNRGIDNRSFPLPQLWQHEAVSAPTPDRLVRIFLGFAALVARLIALGFCQMAQVNDLMAVGRPLQRSTPADQDQSRPEPVLAAGLLPGDGFAEKGTGNVRHHNHHQQLQFMEPSPSRQLASQGSGVSVSRAGGIDKLIACAPRVHLAKPLPNTGAVSGLKETLDFFGDPGFAQRRFETYGDVFATKLLAQPIVFIRGERAINDLFSQSESLRAGGLSVKKLLGSRSLANRSGAAEARRRVVGQLFSSAALARYTPSIIGLVDELADELINSDGPVPLAGRMRRFAFAVIATTVLGLDSESREALFASSCEIWTKALFSIPLAIPGTPFAKAMGARQLLNRIKAVLKGSNQGGLDLISGGLDGRHPPMTTIWLSNCCCCCLPATKPRPHH